MFHKINKLQSDVDELLDLCGDAAETESGSDDFEEMGVMILKAQDGSLGRRAIKRLSRWISGDNRALRYYVDFQSLTVLLYQHFGNDKQIRMPDILSRHVADGLA